MKGTGTRRAKPILHFWRSRDDEGSKDKTFLLVYKDDQDREDWTLGIKKDDTEYTAWIIEEWPREVLDLPFDLTEQRRIPLKIWDAVDAKETPKRLVGGPQPKKWVRAKRRRKA